MSLFGKIYMAIILMAYMACYLVYYRVINIYGWFD